MGDDLVTWLRAQLDDDERAAREATPGHWQADAAPDGRWYIDPGRDADDVGEVARRADAEHIARHDPARVLAEVDAKRRILDACPPEDDFEQRVRFGSWESCSDGCPADVMLNVVKLLALPYADRPGYRDEWRPVT